MVYTFDIFDTLITRTVAEPMGIFVIMRDILNQDARFAKLPSHVKKHFCEFRMNAESEAHHRAAKSGREDATLDMIYEQLSYMNYIPKELTVRLKELELAVEVKHSVPVYHNIDKLKNLKKEHDIYLLSDMYLPVEHIRKMLVAVDEVFKDIPILVSGEIGKNKSSGKLYAYFLDRYGIDKSEWIHIGDNLKSDGIMADRAGAKSELYFGYEFSEYERRLLEKQGKTYAVQFTLGTVKNVNEKRHNINGKTMSASEQVGVSVGGPILFGYVLWVLQEALKQGIHTLFFVARDGYLLKQIADRIILERKMDIQTRYLYGSRYAWRLAAASRNRAEFNAWVEKYVSFSTFAELAEELHLEKGELEVYFSPLLQAEGKQLSGTEKQFMKEILKAEETIFEIIAEKQVTHREEAKAYLRQELTSAQGRAAFVELNGTGRSQCSMQALIEDFFKEPVISFFYAITNAVDVEVNHNIFYKYTYEKQRIDTVIEMLTRAPHGQTKGYCQGVDGKWAPVLEESCKEYPEEKVYESYINGVLEYVGEAIVYCQCSGEDLSELSLMYVDHICRKPELKVQMLIGNIPSSEEGTGVGTKLYAPLLTDEQLKQLFLYHRPVQECYMGVQLEFSLLRLTREQKKRMELYKKLGAAGLTQDGGAWKYSMEVTGKVVLYGAGQRGQRLYREIQKNNKAEIVLWADANYKDCGQRELEIVPPEKILEVSYDYLLIGIADFQAVKEARRDLRKLGVPSAKILWQ